MYGSFAPTWDTIYRHLRGLSSFVKMADRLAFLLFGDQSLDTHGFLADFMRRGEQGILAKTFVEQSTRALVQEVEGLTALDREQLPTFRSLSQLNERYHARTIKHPGIDAALLCVSQLAHYIEYVQRRLNTPRSVSLSIANYILSYAERNWEDVTNRKTFNVGLCIGLFAATAVASTPSLSALVPVAVEMALMAFRVGTHVHSLAEKLSPTLEASESWTHIYPGVKELQAAAVLADFHESEVSEDNPRASPLYVHSANVHRDTPTPSAPTSVLPRRVALLFLVRRQL